MRKSNMKIFEVTVHGNPMSRNPIFKVKVEGMTERSAINKVRRMVDSRSSILNITQL